MEKRIYVIDDEPQIIQAVSQYLNQEGFITIGETNPQKALDRLQNGLEVDLILLDWMMPKLNGMDLCKQIRTFSHIPIIFLTAKTDEYEMLLGLELGADDYITKPFSMRELVTRIRVVLRRTPTISSLSHREHQEMIVVDELKVSPYSHQAWLGEQEIDCTLSEFKVLSTLASHPGRVYSRAQLIEVSLGEEYLGYERTIDTHIHNLRKKMKKISPNFNGIRTVFGVGYTLGDRK
ncbi:response regulator transcription factor [Hazenella coriacea]|uniref:DNA-binding response OmpR family regulator n=1 Tax=Hazenella coriacea TaxID=1179467 RepID=A0A4R3L0V1_9BACL|nr:response regulator transcription factor [Hazenella coriacea]TCS92822.1 DNA-binding response OmpR family regulator [Hazenella coriacea]